MFWFEGCSFVGYVLGLLGDVCVVWLRCVVFVCFFVGCVVRFG